MSDWIGSNFAAFIAGNIETIIVINKCDVKNHKIHDLHGFGKKIFISAAHISGIADLKWEIYNLLEKNDEV